MTDTTYLLGRLAALFLLIFWAALGVALFVGRDAPGRLWVRGYEAGLEKQLRFIRARATARGTLWTQAGLSALCLGVAVWTRNWALCFGVGLIAFFPSVYLSRKVTQRTTRFDEQLDTWLGAIANALQASPSLGEAIASTIPLVPAPMSQEIDILVKENELGTPLDRALDNLSERINTKTLSATVLALKVARKSGGNLPEMLNNATAALRELARLEGVVRTKTAEGKAQAWVIAAIPVPMVGGLDAMDPKFFEPLFQTFTGNFVIVLAGILWLLAIVAAQKILAVDV